jgi:carboxylesterase type B
MATRTLDHEILGQIRGIVSEDGRTLQYRGIKFADIPGRWQDPVLLSGPLSEKAEPFDATKFGPSCTQNPNGWPFDLSLIGNVSLEPEKVGQSEFDCLNLVVTVPTGIKKLEGLPVMVWYVLRASKGG